MVKIKVTCSAPKIVLNIKNSENIWGVNAITNKSILFRRQQQGIRALLPECTNGTFPPPGRYPTLRLQ